MPQLHPRNNQPVDFIRMSSIGGCELQTAYRTMGMQESRRGPNNSMALKMGTALEPVINDEMEANGALVHFGGDFQIELAYKNLVGHTIMRGHPDGLISFGPFPSTWLLHELPKSALSILTSGGTMLWEVKTMNDESWTAFNRDGLSATPLLSKYFYQVQSYLGALRYIRDNDAIVDMSVSEIDPTTLEPVLKSYSFGLMEWLAEQKMAFPEVALLCGFNTATKKFAFKTIPFDERAFNGLAERANRILYLLEQSELPEPTYDGHSTECYFCGYASLCPAVKQSMTEAIDAMNDIGLMSVTTMSPSVSYTMEELDAAMELYVEANRMEREAKVIKKTNRELITTALTEMGVSGIHSEKYKAKYSPVKGRRSIDLDTIKILLDEGYWDCPKCTSRHLELAKLGLTIDPDCDVCDGEGRIQGLEVPYRRGAPGTRMYIQPLFGESYDDGKGDSDE